MVDGIEQTSLNLIFFPTWFLLMVILCYHGEIQCFFYWQVWGVILEDFYARIAVKSISLYWGSDYGLKPQNE